MPWYRTLVGIGGAFMLGLSACGTDQPTQARSQPYLGTGGAWGNDNGTGGAPAGSGGANAASLPAATGNPGTGGSGGSGGGNEVDTVPGGGAPANVASVDCPAAAFAPGTAYEQRSLGHDGRQRVYYIDVPTSVDTGRPSPLVIDIHGNGSSAQREYGQSKLSELALEEAFILVTVEGVSNTWNSDASRSGTDDMGYLNAVIDEVEATVCVDPKRIHMAGMSLGAVTTSTYTCLHGERLAGTAPVEGGLTYSGCQLPRPLPVALFHGTDSFVNINTTGASERDRFIAMNGCSGEPEVTDHGNGSHCSEWTRCDPGGAVLFCVSEGMGHCWPGSPCQLGSANMDIHANRVMWDFWQRHPTL